MSNVEYFGESGRNGFTRGGEHLSNKEAQDENRSVLKLHANHHHGGAGGLHNLFHPTIRDGSTWSNFGARGEHGDDGYDDEDNC